MKRGAGENPSVIGFIAGIYKGMAIRNSELIARVRNESWSVVIYEKEIVKELAI